MSFKTRTGNCMCGNVRITLSADPIATAICHCTDCQKQASSAFSLVVLMPAAAVQVTGKTAMFATRADSGQMAERTFCPNCGSPVRTDTSETRRQGITIIKAGLLDDARELKPTLQVYCDSAQKWLPDLQPLVRFAKMPAQP